LLGRRGCAPPHYAERGLPRFGRGQGFGQVERAGPVLALLHPGQPVAQRARGTTPPPEQLERLVEYREVFPAAHEDRPAGGLHVPFAGHAQQLQGVDKGAALLRVYRQSGAPEQAAEEDDVGGEGFAGECSVCEFRAFLRRLAFTVRT